jgi:hypothetical protein
VVTPVVVAVNWSKTFQVLVVVPAAVVLPLAS